MKTKDMIQKIKPSFEFLKNRTFIHIILFLFLLTFFSGLTLLNYLKPSIIVPGKVSNIDIEAPVSTEIINEIATNEAKTKAAMEVPIIYTQDPSLTYNQLYKINKLFQELKNIKKNGNLTISNKITKIKESLFLDISDKNIQYLIRIPDEQLNQIEIYTKNIFNTIMGSGIKENEINIARANVNLLTAKLKINDNSKKCIEEIVNDSLVPNKIFNWDETSKLQQEKMSQVEPVRTFIQKGQIIVRKGEIVTPQQIEVLKTLDYYKSKFDIKTFFGILLYNLLIIILFIICLGRQQPKFLYNDKNLVLICFILVITAIACKISTNFSPYFIPVAAASVLLTILLDWRIALIATFILSMQTGLLTSNPITVLLAVVTGVTGTFLSSNIERRWDLVICGIVISVFAMITTYAIGLIKNEDLDVLGINILYAGSSGLISAMIASLILPLIEHFFHITTHIKLLELSNPNEPLLQKLLNEAPGTYQHSITVSSLAQRAAQVIGADPLLARVGAYYHDIGKIKRPYFFIENQISQVNPHDKIAPTLSTIIITSHVKDGVELAKQYHLPDAVLNFIKEHHGENLVSFFYHQAKSMGEVNEGDFRYMGPKPQSKETAIVMLADAIEAASRSITNPNPVKIENLIRQIIKDIFLDGQLDESELSFKDINSITYVFIHNLTGMYHHRIEYPEKLREA